MRKKLIVPVIGVIALAVLFLVAESALGQTCCLGDFNDDFEDGVLSPRWVISGCDSATVEELGGKLVLKLPTSCTGPSSVSANLSSELRICGDFDFEAGYIGGVGWTPDDAAWWGIAVYNSEMSMRLERKKYNSPDSNDCGSYTDAYECWYLDTAVCPIGVVESEDVYTKMRIVRNGDSLSTYHWTNPGNTWYHVGTATGASTEPVGLSLFTGNSSGGGQEVRFLFINVQGETTNDTDFDGVGNCADNCPEAANSDQSDTDYDNVGDDCDNCPDLANIDQQDSDQDGVGDSCDLCPGFDDNMHSDSDGIPDSCDNCPLTNNVDQQDSDANGVGDVCEPCCIGIHGNIDGDSAEVIDIADLVHLVDYMFTGGPPPVCFVEADINGDGPIDIADLVHIVDYMFTGGPAPAVCP